MCSQWWPVGLAVSTVSMNIHCIKPILYKNIVAIGNNIRKQNHIWNKNTYLYKGLKEVDIHNLSLHGHASEITDNKSKDTAILIPTAFISIISYASMNELIITLFTSSHLHTLWVFVQTCDLTCKEVFQKETSHSPVQIKKIQKIMKFRCVVEFFYW